ncbi:DUF6236 family protein [Streptomyces sp. NPDC056883]|uniref:DUF6236 family protein n=1 Tax=Streptomyces sp. NPDC056883 TaxID=3345959 RepID=UPI0036C33A11
MLHQGGLYYPYIHFRDENWLKAAALYWPSLGRVVPRGYPVMDSPTVTRLRQGLPRFVHDVDPAAAARAVAGEFIEVLTGGADVLRALHAAHADPEEFGSPLHVGSVNGLPEFAGNRIHHAPTVSRDPSPNRLHEDGLAGVYHAEVDPLLAEALVDSGLALTARSARFREVADAGFLAMSPELAWVYKCALTEELARLGGYAPTTDHAASHTASQGWDSERIARVLLDRDYDSGLRLPDTAGGDLTDAVGMLAVRIVLPADLGRVGIEKIIELRTTHEAAFDRFGQAVTETAEALKADLADVRLPQAARRHLEDEVDRRFRLPLAELEEAMRSLKVDAASGVANLQFALPSVLGLAVGQFTGSPLVATGLGAAFSVAGVARGAHQQKKAALAASPVAYLLSVRGELNPERLLGRMVRRVRPPRRA